MTDFDLRPLSPSDPEPLAAAFAAIGWTKPPEQFRRYLAEQHAGTRQVFVADRQGDPAGYVTLNRRPAYPPFREAGWPAIEDLNVLPAFRRRGLGERLVAQAEAAARAWSDWVGIGVGLSADYGAAQRLYVRLGYVPDGRGIAYADRTVPWGESVRVDDELVLYLVKRLA